LRRNYKIALLWNQQVIRIFGTTRMMRICKVKLPIEVFLIRVIGVIGGEVRGFLCKAAATLKILIFY
jgi:hypothetical protein